MSLSIISARVSKLLLILGIEPQGNAHLIECHLNPVRMNSNFCGHSAEDCKCSRSASSSCQEATSRAAPRQKRLLGNGIGLMTLNCVQHGYGISEPPANPAPDQSLDMRGRNAPTPSGRLVTPSSHQAFGDIIAISAYLFFTA